MRSNPIVTVLLLLISSPALPVYAEVPQLQRANFLTGLDSPWDIAFTPEGAALYTEKCKGLSVRRADGTVARLFGSEGSALVATDFFCEGQSGMHGIAIDPQFTRNRTIYVYLASKLSTPRTNRVVRLEIDKGYTKVSRRADIVADIPFKDKKNAWGGPGSHSGGRLRFGPDGFLYITTGDNHNGSLPQDLKRLGGKVLRVSGDGKAAAGGAPQGADPRIFTYGHRNVQGLSFDPKSGKAFVAEHGPNHSDEVTALTAGGNGGWDPKPDEGVSCADSYCGYISNRRDGKLTSMTDLEKFPNALKPAFVYEDSQGIGPCTFITGTQWKEWNGTLLVGLMAGARVEVFSQAGAGVLEKRATLSLPSERMRSLVQGPDGLLYVVTDGGSIWKVSPQ